MKTSSALTAARRWRRTQRRLRWRTAAEAVVRFASPYSRSRPSTVSRIRRFSGSPKFRSSSNRNCVASNAQVPLAGCGKLSATQPICESQRIGQGVIVRKFNNRRGAKPARVGGSSAPVPPSPLQTTLPTLDVWPRRAAYWQVTFLSLRSWKTCAPGFWPNRIASTASLKRFNAAPSLADNLAQNLP